MEYMMRFLHSKIIVCSVNSKCLKFYGRNSSKDYTLQKQPLGDVCKMDILKDFAKFTGKHLYQILHLMKLQTSSSSFTAKEISTQIFSGEFCGIFNDTHREKLCFTQFSTRMPAWLLVTFFICLHNQLSSIHFIITY